MICKYPPVFARFYDTIYHLMRDSVDSGFFIGEIGKTNGRVLEIGVGTGRLFEHALRSGADIYGIDISESMLDILCKKIPAEQHHRISCQNIINFSFNAKFDLIVAPFRVLMHLTEKEDQLKALNNVRKHLNRNGRFIFDVFVPDLNQIIEGIDNRMDFEGEYEPGKKLRRYVTTVPDLMSQIIEVHFHLEWEDDAQLQHDYWNLQMRFFFRYELEHLIERSDFGNNYEILGDYLGNSLKKDSKEFVLVCHK